MDLSSPPRSPSTPPPFSFHSSKSSGTCLAKWKAATATSLANSSEVDGAAYGASSSDSGSFAPSLTSHHHHKGAVVEVDVATLCHFEIEDPVQSFCDATPMIFTYKHCARKSLLVGRAVGVNDAAGVRKAAAALTPYTGATEDCAMTMYMAVIIGYASMKMPAMYKHCAIVPGFLATLFVASVHLFLTYRLVDVPQLIRQDVEGYGNMAFCMVKRWAYLLIGCLIVVNWSVLCVLFYYELLFYINVKDLRIQNATAKRFLWTFIEIFIVVLLIPITLYSDAKRLRWAAHLSLTGMYCTGGAVVVGGAVHAFENWADLDHDIWLPPRGLYGLCEGISILGVCYSGATILPYIVSDMIEPRGSKRMLKQSVGRITVFYTVVGLFGYLGWGDQVQDVVVNSLKASKKNTFYWLLTQCTNCLMAIKCFSTFPLFVWPLFRELDSYRAPEDSPAVALGLPWAVTQLRRIKVFERVFLCAFLYCVRWLCPDHGTIESFMLVPVHISELILIPIFSIVAILKSNSDECACSINSQRPQPFGGRTDQLVMAVAVGILSIVLGVCLAWHELHSGIFFFANHDHGSDPGVTVEA